MRRKFVAGNWKLNGSSSENEALISGVKQQLADAGDVDVAVCPPYIYLSQVASQLAGSPIKLGSQNVSLHESGAFTGEIAAPMLSDVGCHYVIIGHSERRSVFGETDAMVAEKFAICQSKGLVPILCVGETLEEREAGNAEAVVRTQLEAVLKHVGADKYAQGVIAYEPVWAIGTGKTASPQQAQDMHAFIRSYLNGQSVNADSMQILYGGSVKPNNAVELFSQLDIDGGLIGGASLKADDFVAICAAAR